MSSGGIYVISGPSGCGKNTVFDELKKKSDVIAQTVSVTTRSPREGEAEGREYYFVGVDEFMKRLNGNEFVEFVSYSGNYYGTLKSEIDRLVAQNKKVVLVIEVNGAINIKKIYPEATSIFLLPPSMEELERRILKRGQNSDEEMQRRMAIAAEEMRQKDQYDYSVINDELDVCVNEVYEIMFGVKPEIILAEGEEK